jgi:hypothetical protein
MPHSKIINEFADSIWRDISGAAQPYQGEDQQIFIEQTLARIRQKTIGRRAQLAREIRAQYPQTR